MKGSFKIVIDTILMEMDYKVLNRIIEITIKTIDRHVHMSDQQKIICTYGLDLLLYTIISSVGLLIIGFMFQMPLQAGIIILTFYINQSTGGGFHAHSHFSCFLTMAIGLTISLLIIQHRWSVNMLLLMGIIACAILFMCPLILHKNKAYLEKRKPQMIRRSRIVTLIELLVALALIYISNGTTTNSYIVGLFISSISRLYAIL